MNKDNIYSLPLKRVGDFQFDEHVVKVFPDMISRSVPGYGSILAMIGELVARYSQPQTNIYDLGCSLGACTQVMQERMAMGCIIHAVDSSPAMIDGLRDKMSQQLQSASVVYQLADIREIEISQASFSVLNFTLQFVPQKERESLLSRIAEGTRKGGALVLSEKICFADEAQQRLLTELHHSFKSANGYSDLEIAQKRTAIENTLIPETLETHISRLRRVGFQDITCWFQCFNFVSILAVK